MSQFEALNQVAEYHNAAALEFSYDVSNNRTLTSSSSGWMTLRSGVTRIVRALNGANTKGTKTAADLRKNQDSINALLNYIQAESSKQVADYVRDGIARLGGDSSESRYTVADRITRGSFVSKALVLRIQQLALEGAEKEQRIHDQVYEFLHLTPNATTDSVPLENDSDLIRWMAAPDLNAPEFNLDDYPESLRNYPQTFKYVREQLEAGGDPGVRQRIKQELAQEMIARARTSTAEISTAELARQVVSDPGFLQKFVPDTNRYLSSLTLQKKKHAYDFLAFIVQNSMPADFLEYDNTISRDELNHVATLIGQFRKTRQPPEAGPHINSMLQHARHAGNDPQNEFNTSTVRKLILEDVKQLVFIHRRTLPDWEELEANENRLQQSLLKFPQYAERARTMLRGEIPGRGYGQCTSAADLVTSVWRKNEQ